MSGFIGGWIYSRVWVREWIRRCTNLRSMACTSLDRPRYCKIPECTVQIEVVGFVSAVGVEYE